LFDHAVDFAQGARQVLVVLGKNADAGSDPLVAVLRKTFVPHVVALVMTEQDVATRLGTRMAWTEGKRARDGRTTAYVCERGACKFPTTEVQTFENYLTDRGGT